MTLPLSDKEKCMIVKSAELETVCGITSKLPDNDLPEIAFAGKSNVGKSSLINGLLNRKSLARTSAQPGKTQTINFYNVNKICTLWICRDMDMQSIGGDKSKMGQDDREIPSRFPAAQKGIPADRHKTCAIGE